MYLCSPKPKADVVKWKTRHFEGVVGVSLCEFDSRHPHHTEETCRKLRVSFWYNPC